QRERRYRQAGILCTRWSRSYRPHRAPRAPCVPCQSRRQSCSRQPGVHDLAHSTFDRGSRTRPNKPPARRSPLPCSPCVRRDTSANPRRADWQTYLSGRMASTARETGAQAVYLDEFGCRDRRCYAPNHGHPVGANMIAGEIGMERKVREALDAARMTSTIVYTECPPVDIAAPFVDGSFTYALPSSAPGAYGIKLNLWRFAFPQVRLWDMVSSGVEPHILSAEDFRYAFW